MIMIGKRASQRHPYVHTATNLTNTAPWKNPTGRGRKFPNRRLNTNCLENDGRKIRENWIERSTMNDLENA